MHNSQWLIQEWAGREVLPFDFFNFSFSFCMLYLICYALIGPSIEPALLKIDGNLQHFTVF